MINDEFLKLLLVGSYLFSAGCYVFGFWIIRCLNKIQNTLSKQMGVIEGQDLAKRVYRLEIGLGRKAAAD